MVTMKVIWRGTWDKERYEWAFKQVRYVYLPSCAGSMVMVMVIIIEEELPTSDVLDGRSGSVR
jgi:hypothetical protein